MSFQIVRASVVENIKALYGGYLKLQECPKPTKMHTNTANETDDEAHSDMPSAKLMHKIKKTTIVVMVRHIADQSEFSLLMEAKRHRSLKPDKDIGQ